VRPTRAYLLAGVAAHALMLVATLPAHQAYRFLPSAAHRAVTLYGLEGTVWNGRATAARIGPLELGPLRWDVGLLRLPLGQVRVAWSVAGTGTAGNGIVQAGLWGGLRLPELTLQVPMATLQRHLPLPVTLGGALEVRLHDIVLHDARLQRAAGTLTWRDAAVRWTDPIRLGTLVVKLEPGAKPIRGTLRNRGGPLEIRGTITLSPAGRLHLNATVLPHAGAPKPLLQALRASGRPDATGRYHLRWSGRLPAL
jgi:general secretion pathway protein N